MTRKKLLEKLEERGVNYSDVEYHKTEDVQSVVKEILDNGDESEDVSFDDLQDDMFSYCDSATPIYNADRAEWFGENWTAYDDVAEELGRDSMGDDIMQGIGVAYCVTLEREVRAVLESLFEEEESEESESKE